MKQELNPVVLGGSLAIISAIIMFILGIFGNLGWYMGAVRMMQDRHMVFSSSILGIIGGMIEAAIISYLVGYGIAWTYNRLL